MAGTIPTSIIKDGQNESSNSGTKTQKGPPPLRVSPLKIPMLMLLPMMIFIAGEGQAE